MRIIPLILACLLFGGVPAASMAAGSATSVRAISFVASQEKGPSDSRLAAYEGVLRSRLRFESFRYVGESSTSVPSGGRATLSVPSGRIELEADQEGNVKAHRGGTVVSVSRGRPTVFVGGSGGGGEASGVIVMAQ